MMPSKPDLTRVCKFNCCYGCETYTVPANISLRIYSKDNDKYRHVNIWQYLQLGLLVAASQIKTDFQSTIEVNYTIRKEAFACEENLLGQNSKSVEEIMSTLERSRASVNSYLPYTKIIYKMKESSVGADREKLYRERKKAVAEMAEEPSADNLWNAIVAFQGYPFKTSKGLSFTYKVKGGELFFTRKEKSITRSTVDIAFQKALELGEKATGPKKLGVFGASYLYPVFVRLGVINKRWQESTSQNTIVAEK